MYYLIHGSSENAAWPLCKQRFCPVGVFLKFAQKSYQVGEIKKDQNSLLETQILQCLIEKLIFNVFLYYVAQA